MYNYRIGASYDTEITGDVTGYANFSYSKTGNRFVAPDTTTGLSSADPYFGINSTIGVRYDRYDVSVFGTNLTDERGPSIGTSLSTINTRGGAVITPRTIGLRLRVNAQ